MDVNAWIEEANNNPLERTLFTELWVFAQESLIGKRRAIPPRAERCLEDLPAGTVVLTDIPMNQMGFGLVGECHRRFPNRRQQAESLFKSFMWRYWALSKALKDDEAKRYVRPATGGREISAALLFAAAECPLRSDSADFDDTLFARANQISDEEGET